MSSLKSLKNNVKMFKPPSSFRLKSHFIYNKNTNSELTCTVNSKMHNNRTTPLYIEIGNYIIQVEAVLDIDLYKIYPLPGLVYIIQLLTIEALDMM